MMNTVCALCGTNEYATLLYPANVKKEDLDPQRFSARRLPDRIHETIVKCKKCGLVYAQNLLDHATLAGLYKQSEFTYDAEEKYIRATYKRYLGKALKHIDKKRHPLLSYLDIGCGNGFMLHAARELGFEQVYGVEPSEHAISRADPAVATQIFCGMFSASLLHDKKFDLISCFQTLDHLPDPVGFVNECKKILRPGGVILCINHNIGSWTAAILGERCPMIDIEHTFLHTPHTMKELFQRAGFIGIATFSVRNDYPIYFWLRLLPLPKKVKLALIRLCNFIGIGNLIVPLFPGNLGLIARHP